MPSIQRPLSGDILIFDLASEREIASDPSILERSGRSARTLLKDGSLRVTLVVLAPGGELRDHSAAGPITVQPLEGRIQFVVGDEVHELNAGQLLTLGPEVVHAVRSDEGASFLLTIQHPDD